MNRKGFTMIELLVAVAIMGVLTIIAIPSVKHIQTNNSKTKYEAYEKAITSSSKAYVDSYDEDLFGSVTTGCAAISYEDLKKKDLISDIQLKDVDCSNKDEKNTYVYVKKDKRGNHHYKTYIACRDSKGNILYKNGPDTLPPCELDNDDPPTIEITDVSPYYKSDKQYYYIDEEPYIKVYITDFGVGLKARQKLSYQWFKITPSGDVPFGAGGTVNFNNANYDPDGKGYVKAPADIDNIDESTNYKLVLDGTISDVLGSQIKGPWEYTVKYFVGKYLISYNANQGSANANGYTVASDGTIKYNGTAVVQKVKYKGSLASPGILSLNNSSGLNLTRSARYIEAGHEWNTNADGSGRNFKQGTYGDNAKVTDLCDAKKKECQITLYADWKIVYCNLTYDSNGGSACTGKTVEQYKKWGKLCSPTKDKHEFVGWYKGSTHITKDSEANCDTTVKASWKELKLKPEKPSVTNPYGSSWTKNNTSLTLKTTTPSKYIGKWYYKIDSGKWYQFKDTSDKVVTGDNSFISKAFKGHGHRKVTVKVCSIYADSMSDSDNCSDTNYAYLKIDKKVPVCGEASTGYNGIYDLNESKFYCQDPDSGTSQLIDGSNFTTGTSVARYCYGTCVRYCGGYHDSNVHEPNSDTIKKYGYYLKTALIAENLEHNSTKKKQVILQTARACNGGHYTMHSEVRACDMVGNCKWYYFKFVF